MKDISIKTVVSLLKVDAVLLIFLFIGLTATTYAYLFSTDAVHNPISVGYNESEIIEEFEQYEKFNKDQSYVKRVSVKNTGTVDCYVRILAEIEDPFCRKNIEIDVDNNNWRKDSDGYYYYRGILRVGQMTEPLFTSLIAKENIDEFNMICYEETVQSRGFENAKDAFDSLK